jgi:hypothetical protein
MWRSIAALALIVVVLTACGPAPLPTATAALGSAHVSLPRGSYCWSSWGKAVCADSAGAETLLRSGYLKPYEITGGEKTLITLSPSPRTTTAAMAYSDGGATGAVAFSGGSLVLPSQPGTYVYSIFGTWPEGDVDFFLAVRLTTAVP